MAAKATKKPFSTIRRRPSGLRRISFFPRIRAALTDETRQAIIRLKCQTPDDLHIMGIDYCRAVMADGVRTLPEMLAWHAAHRTDGIVEWMP